MLDDDDGDAHDKWEYQSIWDFKIQSSSQDVQVVKEMKMYRHLLFSGAWKCPVRIGEDTVSTPQHTYDANRGKVDGWEGSSLIFCSASSLQATPDPVKFPGSLSCTRAPWTDLEHPFLLSGNSTFFVLGSTSWSLWCHAASQEPVITFVPGCTLVSPKGMSWTILHHCDFYE